MPEFETLFFASNGRPIRYNGQTLYICDQLTIGEVCRIRLVRASTKSKYRQGITLVTRGTITVNGISFKDQIALWEDTAPDLVDLEISSTSGWLRVMNIWEHTMFNGVTIMDMGHNGAAMKREEIEGGYRYYCNDGEPDEDFDDIIFEVIINPDSTT